MDPNSDTQATDTFGWDLLVDGHAPPVRSKPPRPRYNSSVVPQPASDSSSESTPPTGQAPTNPEQPTQCPIIITQPAPIPAMTMQPTPVPVVTTQPKPVQVMAFQAPPTHPAARLRGGNESICGCLCALCICCNECYMDEICCDCFY